MNETLKSHCQDLSWLIDSIPWVAELGLRTGEQEGERNLPTHLFQLLLHHIFVCLAHF